jgi:hypothetical protein
MGTFTALLLATPIFGFALNPPSVAPVPVTALPVTAQLETSLDLEADSEAPSADVSEGLPPEPVLGPGSPAYVQQLRKRARIAKVHRTLGIATWATMGLAVIAGTIQYRNLYGAPFVTEREDTPCVQGDAWINQKQCSGTPWFHAITGYATGALYFTTLGLAIAMPDPDHASHGTSKYAKTVRTHKALRWVHLTGMVTQIVLGILIANPRLGLDDRANNYGAVKALAGMHLVTGYVTLGALSWAGTIMLL